MPEHFELPEPVRKWLQEWGRRGGAKSSAAKQASNRENAMKRWSKWRLSPDAKKVAQRKEQLAEIKAKRKHVKSSFKQERAALFAIEPAKRKVQLARLSERRKVVLERLNAKESAIRRPTSRTYSFTRTKGITK